MTAKPKSLGGSSAMRAEVFQLSSQNRPWCWAYSIV